MRILKFKDKLIEEIAYTHSKTVFFKFLKTEDKRKCKCGEPIDEEHSIVEDSQFWRENIKPVETLTQTTVN